MTMPFLLPAAATRKNTRHLFSGKNISFAALLACVFWAFARGFYLPSAWTLNYYLINPFDGFYRRALLGAFLYPFGDLRLHYWFVASIQMIVSAILLFVVLRKIYHIKKGWEFIYLYLCAFFLSNYGAFFFGITGHPEFVIYLVTLCAFQVKNGTLRALMMACSVWIHEMAVFTALPLYFAIEYLYFHRRKAAFGAVALCFASFCAIYLFFQTVDNETIIAYKQFISASDYNIRFQYLKVFQNDFLGERLKWQTYYGDYPMFRKSWCIELCFLLAIMGTIHFFHISCSKYIESSIAFFGALSPLVMGFFAWDTNRWIFLSLINLSAIFLPSMTLVRSKFRFLLLIVALAGFCTTGVYLFDDRTYRTIMQSIDFLQNFNIYVSILPI